MQRVPVEMCCWDVIFELRRVPNSSLAMVLLTCRSGVGVSVPHC